MDAFLGPSCFEGRPAAGEAFGGPFAGAASFAGCILFSNQPRETVARLLPPDLELGVNLSPVPDLHPLVFLFGSQTEGSTIFGGITVPLGVAYQELALAVPCVRHRGGRRLHLYVPRMYSSYFPSTWNGRQLYGYGKRMGRMRWQGPMFLLTSEDGELLLHASVATSKRWSSASGSRLPHFDEMRSVFSLPVVGRKPDGAYVCSYFDWDFADAQVRHVDACAVVDQPLVDGLDAGTYPDVSFGSFEVRGMTWRLSWPEACRF